MQIAPLAAILFIAGIAPRASADWQLDPVPVVRPETESYDRSADGWREELRLSLLNGQTEQLERLTGPTGVVHDITVRAALAGLPPRWASGATHPLTVTASLEIRENDLPVSASASVQPEVLEPLDEQDDAAVDEARTRAEVVRSFRLPTEFDGATFDVILSVTGFGTLTYTYSAAETTPRPTEQTTTTPQTPGTGSTPWPLEHGLWLEVPHVWSPAEVDATRIAGAWQRRYDGAPPSIAFVRAARQYGPRTHADALSFVEDVVRGDGDISVFNERVRWGREFLVASYETIDRTGATQDMWDGHVLLWSVGTTIAGLFVEVPRGAGDRGFDLGFDRYIRQRPPPARDEPLHAGTVRFDPLPHFEPDLRLRASRFAAPLTDYAARQGDGEDQIVLIIGSADAPSRDPEDPRLAEFIHADDMDFIALELPPTTTPPLAAGSLLDGEELSVVAWFLVETRIYGVALVGPQTYRRSMNATSGASPPRWRSCVQQRGPRPGHRPAGSISTEPPSRRSGRRHTSRALPASGPSLSGRPAHTCSRTCSTSTPGSRCWSIRTRSTIRI